MKLQTVLKFIKESYLSRMKPQMFTNNMNLFNISANGKSIYYSGLIKGIRCLSIIDDVSITYISKNGKIFKNFDVFNTELRNAVNTYMQNNGGTVNYPIIFDGLVTNDTINLEKILELSGNIQNVKSDTLRYVIMDVVDIQNPFSKRYENLNKLNIPVISQENINDISSNLISSLQYNLFKYDEPTAHNIKAEFNNYGFTNLILRCPTEKYVFNTVSTFGTCL